MSTGEQQFQTIRNDERGAVGRSIVVGVILTFLIETCLGLWRIESSIKPSPSALNEWERPTLTSNPLVYPAYQRPPRKLPTVEIGFVNDKMGDIIDSGPQGKGIAYPLASLFLQGHYDGWQDALKTTIDEGLDGLRERDGLFFGSCCGDKGTYVWVTAVSEGFMESRGRILEQAARMPESRLLQLCRDAHFEPNEWTLPHFAAIQSQRDRADSESPEMAPDE